MAEVGGLKILIRVSVVWINLSNVGAEERATDDGGGRALRKKNRFMASPCELLARWIVPPLEAEYCSVEINRKMNILGAAGSDLEKSKTREMQIPAEL